MSDPTGLWNLRASPETLRTLAAAWRSMRDAATTAEDTAHRSAVRAIGGGLWMGETAEAYDRHRVKVNRDVADLAERAGATADVLEELASLLVINQELLLAEWNRLADVPVSHEPGLTFQPQDEEQAQRVASAITAANEIRSHVDEQVAAKLSVFRSEQGTIDAVAERWSPRTLRMVNLNIGSGNDRWPVGKDGVDPGEVDELAALIGDQDADIVTLQEVFEEDLDGLAAGLEERTGAQWEVRYEEASRKDRWTSWDDVRLDRSYGNAVLVRTGGVVEGAEPSEKIELDPGGRWEEPPTIPSPGTPPGPDTPEPDGGLRSAEGEPRIATEVEVRLDPR